MHSVNLNHLINCPDLADSELRISVNPSPIGGFRGAVGTVELRHCNGIGFENWSHKTLADLAEIYNQILNIHERHGIRNTLVFGKQETGQFSMSFVPYPRCNLLEKYQATWHTIFGAPPLSDLQIGSIKTFYDQAFVSSHSQQHSAISAEKKKKKEKDSAKNIDPFCRDNVVNRQKILDYTSYQDTGKNYTVLHDSIPKGASRNDPHFLIIPEKEAGHVDGSSVPVIQRQHMLEIAQKVMRLLSPYFGTILYLERNGSHLRGVQHQHINMIGIQSFPNTFLEQIAAVIRQFFLLWLPFLGNLFHSELQRQIDTYRPTLTRL